MVKAGFEPVQFQNLNAILSSSTNELLIPGLAPEHTRSLKKLSGELEIRVMPESGDGRESKQCFLQFFSEDDGRMWQCKHCSGSFRVGLF